jgi:hypothetical protein
MKNEHDEEWMRLNHEEVDIFPVYTLLISKYFSFENLKI